MFEYNILALVLICTHGIIENGPGVWCSMESHLDLDYVETFENNPFERWIPSKATEKENVSLAENDIKFKGQWNVATPEVYPTRFGAIGLTPITPKELHAISTLLPSKINIDNRTLVVQYEVRFQEGLTCSGAYIKLIADDSNGFSPETFDDRSRYAIMFGPDKCGSMDMVRFIFQHRNPVTGQYEEKHFNRKIPSNFSRCTTLYTLAIHPDNSFNISINQKGVFEGSLLKNFTPPVNPPGTIEDPADTKPEEWDDRETIPDQNAKKPDGWNDDEPMYVEDPNAKMPAGWLVNEPLYIPDKSAKKPENWDDEDLEWQPPHVLNPKCKNVPGCGAWVPPKIPNEKYRGKWKPPQVPNPNFMGKWKPQMIANPNYFEDAHPHNLGSVSAIGFEELINDGGIMISNIIIASSEEAAFKFANETWRPAYEEETRLDDIEKRKDKSEGDAGRTPKTMQQLLGAIAKYIKYLPRRISLFLEDLYEDPAVCVLNYYPEIASLVILVLSLIILQKLLRRGTARKKPETTNAGNIIKE